MTGSLYLGRALHDGSAEPVFEFHQVPPGPGGLIQSFCFHHICVVFKFQVSEGWEPGFRFQRAGSPVSGFWFQVSSFSRPQTWFPQVGTRHAVSLQADVVICHLYSVICHLYSGPTKRSSKACSSGHYTVLPCLLARDIEFEVCITACQTGGYDALRAYPP